MNFFGWYGLVSLYPLATFRRKGVTVQNSEKVQECFRKYGARGFDLMPIRNSIDPLHEQRHLHDDNHWSLIKKLRHISANIRLQSQVQQISQDVRTPSYRSKFDSLSYVRLQLNYNSIFLSLRQAY